MAHHTQPTKKVLLLSYTAVDASHNAFLCLCAIEISKIILPISIYFKAASASMAHFCGPNSLPSAYRHPDINTCSSSLSSWLELQPFYRSHEYVLTAVGVRIYALSERGRRKILSLDRVLAMPEVRKNENGLYRAM